MKNEGTRPTVASFMEVAREYRVEWPEGASLHIVVSDGNVEDSNVVFCHEDALKRRDGYGAALALLLLHMTKSQRGRVARDWCLVLT